MGKKLIMERRKEKIYSILSSVHYESTIQENEYDLKEFINMVYQDAHISYIYGDHMAITQTYPYSNFFHVDERIFEGYTEPIKEIKIDVKSSDIFKELILLFPKLIYVYMEEEMEVELISLCFSLSRA